MVLIQFRRNRFNIQKALLLTLDCATRYCYITTPYFLPPQALKNALIQAAKRGVDVKILTAVRFTTVIC